MRMINCCFYIQYFYFDAWKEAVDPFHNCVSSVLVNDYSLYYLGFSPQTFEFPPLQRHSFRQVTEVLFWPTNTLMKCYWLLIVTDSITNQATHTRCNDCINWNIFTMSRLCDYGTPHNKKALTLWSAFWMITIFQC